MASVGFTSARAGVARRVQPLRSDRLGDGSWLTRRRRRRRPRAVDVPAGSYRPLFPSSPEEKVITVERFRIAKRPSPISSFAVRQRASRGAAIGVSRLFADGRHLSHWDAADASATHSRRTRSSTSAGSLHAPTVRPRSAPGDGGGVEYVAAASERRADGRKDAAWSARILRWYAALLAGPNALSESSLQLLRRSGHARPGLGVVSDFDANLVIGDSRARAKKIARRSAAAARSTPRVPRTTRSFMRSASGARCRASTSCGTWLRCARGPEET
jgi:hypothetical protein